MIDRERESPFGTLLSRRPLERLKRALIDRGESIEGAEHTVGVLERFYGEVCFPQLSSAESAIIIHEVEGGGYCVELSPSTCLPRYELEGKRGPRVNWQLFRRDMRQFNKELERRLSSETSGRIPIYFLGDRVKDRKMRTVGNLEIIDLLGITIEREEFADQFVGFLSEMRVSNKIGKII